MDKALQPGDTAIVNGHPMFMEGDTVVLGEAFADFFFCNGINKHTGRYSYELVGIKQLSQPEAKPHNLLNNE